MRLFERVGVVIDDQRAMMGGDPEFVAMARDQYARVKKEFEDGYPLAARGGVQTLRLCGVLLVDDPLVSPGHFYPVFRV